MSTNLTHLFCNIQLVCLGLHQEKKHADIRNSLGRFYQSLWTLSMGFLTLPKFNHFSGRFAWLVLSMDLKILLSPKILEPRKTDTGKLMQFCDPQNCNRILLQSNPVWTKNMKKPIPKWFGSKVLSNLSSPAVQWESQH